MFLAFGTFTPIAFLIGMEFIVNTTESIFLMITVANIENSSCLIKVDTANGAVATFSLLDGTLFSAKTAVCI
jgi:hypothetical protein